MATSPAVDSAMVSARCRDGSVYVSAPLRPNQDRQIPFGNYHNFDYNLFYMNVRENAAARAAERLRT